MLRPCKTKNSVRWEKHKKGKANTFHRVWGIWGWAKKKCLPKKKSQWKQCGPVAALCKSIRQSPGQLGDEYAVPPKKGKKALRPQNRGGGAGIQGVIQKTLVKRQKQKRGGRSRECIESQSLQRSAWGAAAGGHRNHKGNAGVKVVQNQPQGADPYVKSLPSQRPILCRRRLSFFNKISRTPTPSPGGAGPTGKEAALLLCLTVSKRPGKVQMVDKSVKGGLPNRSANRK